MKVLPCWIGIISVRLSKVVSIWEITVAMTRRGRTTIPAVLFVTILWTLFNNKAVRGKRKRHSTKGQCMHYKSFSVFFSMRQILNTYYLSYLRKGLSTSWTPNWFSMDTYWKNSLFCFIVTMMLFFVLMYFSTYQFFLISHQLEILLQISFSCGNYIPKFLFM